MPSVMTAKQNLQMEIFDEYNFFDKNIINLYNQNPYSAYDSINIFTNKIINKSVNYMNLNKQKGGNNATK